MQTQDLTLQEMKEINGGGRGGSLSLGFALAFELDFSYEGGEDCHKKECHDPCKKHK